MTDRQISVDCYVRAESLGGSVEGTLTRLRGLVDDDVVDDCTVHLWPARVALTETTDDSDVVETYRTFEAWADRRNVSIEPPFSIETRTSLHTGDQRDILVTPVLCVAVSRDGTLREVVPHHAEGTVNTVEDALSSLRREEVVPVIGE